MKTAVTISLALLLLSASAGDACAWGAVTHAHFATRLGYQRGLPNAQEVYGSTLPDMFNLIYGSPYTDYLWTETHEGFMKVANRCDGRNLEAFAYGFVSHNDTWGADLTAHHDARTMPGTGYVVAKVGALVPALRQQLVDILSGAGVPDAEAVADRLAPGLAENFVETAVDLLVCRDVDPAIGYRLGIAAQLRDYRIPYRLFGAYAADFADEFGIPLVEAAEVLLAAERDHRDFMRTYGYIFTQETPRSIELLATWGAELASRLLASETGIDIAVPAQLLEDFLYDAVLPIIEPDYDAEIAATLEYLESEMPDHGFGAASSEISSTGGGGGETPGAARFELQQNVPNPFNPSTTISYALPEAAYVRLAVYDVRGREIAVLADGNRPEGTHNVSWNAAGMPSGVYFCRLTAGAFTGTRKMCLTR